MQENSDWNRGDTTGCQLMVAVHWESLGLEASQIKELNDAVVRFTGETFGVGWQKEMYRIYVSRTDAEVDSWLVTLRSAGAVEKWARPRHRGREAPTEWDSRIRKEVLDWCVHDPQASPETTTFVLVSNNGQFASMAHGLDRAGVRMHLLSTGPPDHDLIDLFGADRCNRLEVEVSDVWELTG